MKGRPLLLAALACFVAGAVLLVPFRYTATLAIGVILLVAFIVLGVIGFLTPEFLGEEEDRAN
jgi:quinol-cytochrome oxidoreductase complex cytochrome b subunit